MARLARWAAYAAAAGALSACASIGPAPAGEAQPGLERAIAALDLDAVRAAGAASASDAETLVAKGAEAAWRRRDTEALEMFAQAVQQSRNTKTKATASVLEMSVQMRRGAFADAARAGRQALAFNRNIGVAAMQALVVAEALKDEQPTRSVGEARGSVNVTRDFVGLPRAQIVVNGTTQEMVLDTGASFSTVTESTAQRLGLRMLAGDVAIGTAVTRALDSKMAMAERITIGGVEFRDVAFIVVPDAALTMLEGRYTIEAILGMPVFLEMGRISILKESDETETFRFGREAAPLPVEPNLLMAAMAPLVEAVVDPDGQAAKIVLLLDSGANSTSLNARFGRQFLDLLQGVEEQTLKQGGAGGMRDGKKRMLQSLTVNIGGKRLTAGEVPVTDESSKERHGILGQDVLSLGFIADFDEMKLVVGPSD